VIASFGAAGLSLGHRTDREAEHWLHENVRPLGLPGLIACTHLVQVPHPHVAISITAAGPLPLELPAVPPNLRPAAELAAAAHAQRRSGRAALFPGVDRLTGVKTVEQVLAFSAIERVTILGDGPADEEALVETRDFVRPQWSAGRLTLVTVPVAGGRLAPFEWPDPTPCCADHA
jgi:hypothetical protein